MICHYLLPSGHESATGPAGCSFSMHSLPHGSGAARNLQLSATIAGNIRYRIIWMGKSP
jgi:hypothetical protein